MLELLCRNRVEDYNRWWKVFKSHRQAHEAAGLMLKSVWRDQEDGNNVFFLFSVESMEKAKAFVEDPASAEAGVEAGVINGEIHFVETSEAYE